MNPQISTDPNEEKFIVNKTLCFGPELQGKNLILTRQTDTCQIYSSISEFQGERVMSLGFRPGFEKKILKLRRPEEGYTPLLIRDSKEKLQYDRKGEKAIRIGHLMRMESFEFKGVKYNGKTALYDAESKDYYIAKMFRPYSIRVTIENCILITNSLIIGCSHSTKPYCEIVQLKEEENVLEGKFNYEYFGSIINCQIATDQDFSKLCETISNHFTSTFTFKSEKFLEIKLVKEILDNIYGNWLYGGSEESSFLKTKEGADLALYSLENKILFPLEKISFPSLHISAERSLVMTTCFSEFGLDENNRNLKLGGFSELDAEEVYNYLKKVCLFGQGIEIEIAGSFYDILCRGKEISNLNQHDIYTILGSSSSRIRDSKGFPRSFVAIHQTGSTHQKNSLQFISNVAFVMLIRERLQEIMDYYKKNFDDECNKIIDQYFSYCKLVLTILTRNEEAKKSFDKEKRVKIYLESLSKIKEYQIIGHEKKSLELLKAILLRNLGISFANENKEEAIKYFEESFAIYPLMKTGLNLLKILKEKKFEKKLDEIVFFLLAIDPEDPEFQIVINELAKEGKDLA